MPFGVKEEKYYVAYDEQGRRVLKPKDRATEEFLAKKMARGIKRSGKVKSSERTPEQIDSEHIKAMEKAYRQREKAKKLKEKARRKKEWAKIKYAIGKTQQASREGMSLYGRPRRSTKPTGSRGGKNYTIIDGVAYPIYTKKKKRKKDKFSWDDFSLDDKDFKMPNWGDMFD